ncbi:GPI transamidase subunit PIG-U family protein [Heterostelium album PN500]|uniref:GPI transamidase subunit PIG-U family protein n=1 Tax=Heterostelium pallidum (strain ATCC 26659 / Pp 5 / PN500) TaxID=670386 RepID=D3BHL3_HETP5|nr:GPI transamidase subunit PIG-U family protein [Heterostelium album PN500]EFA79190.1 GPI transamidase subunit PIG-U family protein [Heterostelium album PN500]|eukprot:XP_020431311.1 GPI transamidase subunit PIG-U family protein [Heterostelium album PN500]
MKNKDINNRSSNKNNNNTTQKNFIIIILIAIVIRVILYYQGFHNILSHRNEISTPLTAFKRLIEGLHLHSVGLSPYAGSAYHQAPLLLLLFKPFYESVALSQLLFIVVDVVIAILLRSITYRVPKVLPLEMSGDQIPPTSNFPNVVAALYLFNPFTLFTSIGMSTIVFNNLSVITSLYFALKGNQFQSLFFVAMSSYLSIYPIMLVIPVAFILQQQRQTKTKSDNIVFILQSVFFFVFSLVSLLYLSFSLLNSWEFIEKCYGFTMMVEDLTPNIVFEHFRKFFLFIFQYHMWIYQGTGNANFYYTINLVFTLAQVLLIVDSFSVLQKLDYIKKLNSKKESSSSSSSTSQQDMIQHPNNTKEIKQE